MAILEILKFPDPRLRTKAQPVVQSDINADFHRIVDDMYETMYDSKGVGLAATQVNIHQRFFTIDVSEDRSGRMCIINPEIISREGLIYEGEGCLSVGGGAFDKVERAQKVVLKGFDLDWKPIEITAEDLMAVCFQHEIDHLNGILFIDHLSRLKQDRIRKKIIKDQRQ